MSSSEVSVGGAVRIGVVGTTGVGVDVEGLVALGGVGVSSGRRVRELTTVESLIFPKLCW